MKNLFGWDLPPGCSYNDPYAPWNYDPIPEDCPMCHKPNCDDDGNPLYNDPAFCSEKCLKEYTLELESNIIARWEELHESRYV